MLNAPFSRIGMEIAGRAWLCGGEFDNLIVEAV
jgi:hypothetical protein